jgi:hypothetical protein
MGESNCCDPRMAAYRQEIGRLEEKFDGFELHHILRQDNEVVLALIKPQFHAPTSRVNVYNNHVFTLSTNQVPRF